MAVSQSVARPARTALQGGLGYAVIEVLAAFVDLTERQYGALLLLATILLGYVQVLVEDRIGRAVLRKVPGPTVDVVEP